MAEEVRMLLQGGALPEEELWRIDRRFHHHTHAFRAADTV